MDAKYIWPLAGVVLGWVLSLLASGMKDRAEDKRKIGRLLSMLLLIQAQLSTLIAVCDRIKDHVDGWESYERMRKGISERHFLEPNSHIEMFRKSIDEIAGLYPLEALSLQRLLDLLLKNKEASLAASSKSRDLYIRGISAYEVGLELSARELSVITRRFARRHGWITFARVLHREFASRRSFLKNEEFFRRFSQEAFAEMNLAMRTKETPNASVDAKLQSERPNSPSESMNSRVASGGPSPISPHLEN